jgi:hypothetical protein
MEYREGTARERTEPHHLWNTDFLITSKPAINASASMVAGRQKQIAEIEEAE